jgi:t-SNARE complex subunit (syntaxin)
MVAQLVEHLVRGGQRFEPSPMQITLSTNTRKTVDNHHRAERYINRNCAKPLMKVFVLVFVAQFVLVMVLVLVIVVSVS